MNIAAFSQITDKIKEEFSDRPPSARAAIVGRTSAAYDLIAFFQVTGIMDRLLGIYAKDGIAKRDASPSDARPLERLAEDCPALVIISSDEDKEELLLAALPYLNAQTQVVIGGYGHFRFQDKLFERETANAFVPSFANGYPNTLVHLYQCLSNAARLQLDGVVAEFGMFKGGTTMLISHFIEKLDCNWKVYGFDTFDGFPPARSALDMYAHPDCVYSDLDTVRRFFARRNVEIVPGNVVQTAHVLADKDIVLAFIDTDNYTPAVGILEVITDRMVVGGAIVFDHFTGRDRFLYTLGERLAAKRLVADLRFFNLHDTGVFLRVR